MSLKLEYFDIRGRGELPRMIMACGNVAFEDKRISFEEWAEHKLTTPLGSMPVLELDGRLKLAQSGAIVRYLAMKTGLAGKSPTHAAILDMMYETMQEVYWKLPFLEPEGEEKNEKIRKAVEETITPALKVVQKYAQGSKHLVGNSLSYVDLYLVELFVGLEGKPSFNSENFERLKSIFNNVCNIPSVKKYLAGRPERPF